MYSRIAWKARSESTMRLVGWTCSTCGQSISRRRIPIGSPRVIRIGPTSMMLRRGAAISSRSTCEARPRSIGTAASTRPDPTGMSSTTGSETRRDAFVTVIAASTREPATTRSCDSENATRRRIPPSRKGTLSSSSAPATTATAQPSTRPNSAPASTPATSTMTSSQPTGVTASTTRPNATREARPMPRPADRSAPRRRSSGRASLGRSAIVSPSCVVVAPWSVMRWRSPAAPARRAGSGRSPARL